MSSFFGLDPSAYNERAAVAAAVAASLRETTSSTSSSASSSSSSSSSSRAAAVTTVRHQVAAAAREDYVGSEREYQEILMQLAQEAQKSRKRSFSTMDQKATASAKKAKRAVSSVTALSSSSSGQAAAAGASSSSSSSSGRAAAAAAAEGASSSSSSSSSQTAAAAEDASSSSNSSRKTLEITLQRAEVGKEDPLYQFFFDENFKYLDKYYDMKIEILFGVLMVDPKNNQADCQFLQALNAEYPDEVNTLCTRTRDYGVQRPYFSLQEMSRLADCDIVSTLKKFENEAKVLKVYKKILEYCISAVPIQKILFRKAAQKEVPSEDEL